MKQIVLITIVVGILGCGSYYENYPAMREHDRQLMSECLPQFGDPNYADQEYADEVVLSPWLIRILNESQSNIELDRRLSDIESDMRHHQDMHLRRQIEDDYWRFSPYEPGYRINQP